ncbi:hypothetical protein WJ972_18185 [Achromobacter insuavis]
MPYGEKTQETVQQRALAIADYFVSRQAKAMVVACNTATAAAIALLRARHRTWSSSAWSRPSSRPRT